MYRLVLEPLINKHIFSNQLIYWYPLKITPSGQLTSMNIGTNRSFNIVEKAWAGRRIVSTYPLDENSVCFFYLGNQGSPKIFQVFGEKPFLINEGGINYYFSDEEFTDILGRNFDRERINAGLDNLEIAGVCSRLFADIFEPEWITRLTIIDDPYNYCTSQIAPHPILHLLEFVKDGVFSKRYYKMLFQFLLENHFLVHWIKSNELFQDNQNNFSKYIKNISYNEIGNANDLDEAIKKIVIEIFDKFEIFGISDLASQCGTRNSVVKLLFNNLHSLLPKREKEIVAQGFHLFQPKFMVKSIELHFIQNRVSKGQMKTLHHSLKEIFSEVKYRDATLYEKMPRRLRFLCKINLPYPIDYGDLAEEIYIYGDAIKTILAKNGLNNSVEEMWVKEIELQIMTPPQFEDDVKFAISQNWLITNNNSYKDFIDRENMIKIVHINLACDYLIFKKGKFLFSFDFSREFQYTYTILNQKLFLDHNFTQFSQA